MTRAEAVGHPRCWIGLVRLCNWYGDGSRPELVVVGDSTYAALEWRDAVCKSACVITRVRLDAALYAPAPPRKPKRTGGPVSRGGGCRRSRTASPTRQRAGSWSLWRHGLARKNASSHITSATAVWYHSGLPPVPMRGVLIREPAGTLTPQAWLSTRRDRGPVPILTWFIQRWPPETTVAEARAHLGRETPRQWNDRSVSRTTPALLGLSSIVTLIATRLIGDEEAPVRITTWYHNSQPPSPIQSPSYGGICGALTIFPSRLRQQMR